MKAWRTLCLIAAIATIAMAMEPRECPPIAVGSFGSEDFAKAYRLAVEEALAENGFKVVGETEHPAAILAGALTTVFQSRLGSLDTHLFGVLRLTKPNGEVLWSWHTTGHQEPQDWPPLVVEDLQNAIKKGKAKVAPVAP